MSESTTTSEAHRAAGSIAAPTPSAPSLAATAAAAVLATTELLEHILTSLTLLDVVHAGTVSQKWHAVLACSSQLRPALFLEATRTPAKLNPFAKTPSPEDYDDPSACSWDRCSSSSPVRLVVDLHPALNLVSSLHCDGVRCTIDLHNLIRWRQHGQWRHMLLTLPPCSQAIVECSAIDSGGWPALSLIEAMASPSAS